jgi:copper homeostasis protein CutC
MDELKAGSKFDGDKNRLELVDALAIEGIGKVLTFGAKKYAANNWRNGIEYTRLIGAIKRHLSSIEQGEDIDPESNLPHIDHLGCEWMFLSNFMKTRPDLDNRWKAK